MDQGQPVQDLCPDGSYVIPYEDIQKSTYNKQVLMRLSSLRHIGRLSPAGTRVGRECSKDHQRRSWDADRHRAAHRLCGVTRLPRTHSQTLLVVLMLTAFCSGT